VLWRAGAGPDLTDKGPAGLDRPDKAPRYRAGMTAHVTQPTIARESRKLATSTDDGRRFG
jgi:hypothetical protein